MLVACFSASSSPDPTTATDPSGAGRASKRRRVGIGSFAALIVGGLLWLFWAFASDRAQRPETVRSRMHADLRAGRHAQAAGALGWLERHDRLLAQDWMVRARLAQLDGRPDEAIDSLKRVDDRDPLGSRARLMAGLIELERHRARPAEAAFRKSIELDPGQASARLELVRLYSRQQRLVELDEQFEALAERESLDYGYVRFWFMTRNAPWNVAEDLDPLRQMVEADPEDRWSRLALAQGLRRLGRADEAEETLGGIPESDPIAHATRAQVAIDRGDLERAQRLLADDRAQGAPIFQLRGQLAVMREDGPAAVRWFRQAYEAKPDDRTTLTGLATALRLAGKPADAEPLQARARRFDEFSPLIGRIGAANAATDGDLHRRLGAICEAVGRRSEARAWYRLAIARDPLDAEAQRAIFRLETATGKSRPR
jgi:tetratricopeptide (TPR) repeat protein